MKPIIIVFEDCELDVISWIYVKQEHAPIKSYMEEDNVLFNMKTQKEDSYKSCVNDPKRVDKVKMATLLKRIDAVLVWSPRHTNPISAENEQLELRPRVT
jgi:hypothetical protein